MRWQPAPRWCPECGFDWEVPVADAVTVVATTPAAVRQALDRGDPRSVPAPGVWSRNEYLWHLVDVFRIGAERLWTLELDPGAGVPCWDEQGLAAARRYAALSPAVGRHALDQAVAVWLDAARLTPPDACADHPVFGELTTADIVRRNAHEAVHHLHDMLSQLDD